MSAWQCHPNNVTLMWKCNANTMQMDSFGQLDSGRICSMLKLIFGRLINDVNTLCAAEWEDEPTGFVPPVRLSHAEWRKEKTAGTFFLWFKHFLSDPTEWKVMNHYSSCWLKKMSSSKGSSFSIRDFLLWCHFEHQYLHHCYVFLFFILENFQPNWPKQKQGFTCGSMVVWFIWRLSVCVWVNRSLDTKVCDRIIRL